MTQSALFERDENQASLVGSIGLLDNSLSNVTGIRQSWVKMGQSELFECDQNQATVV